jgi:hypothetical protein
MYVLRTFEAPSDLFMLMFPLNSCCSYFSALYAFKVPYYFSVFYV